MVKEDKTEVEVTVNTSVTTLGFAHFPPMTLDVLTLHSLVLTPTRPVPRAMVTPVPSLEYSELTESEIRLVSFQESHHRRDHLRLRLQHFDLRQAPAYLALSYVWGDIGCERPINVNGSSLGITNGVRDALYHIYNLSLCFEEGLGRKTGKGRKKLFLWIDAICINQKDMDEKAEQVPRMAEIYSSAFTVLVWLGTIQNLNPDPAAFKYLLSILVTIRPVSDFEIPRLDIQAPRIALGK